MKWFFALLGACTLGVAGAQEKPPEKKVDYKEAAKTFLEQLNKGAFAEATRSFDATMLKVMPADKMQDTWKLLTTQVGPFKKQGAVRQEAKGKYEVVIITCEFEKMSLDARVVFDKENKISGLNFRPVAADYKAPAYVRAAAFRDSDVEIGSGEWALPGTLSMPVGEGPFPAVVLVHGSGPNDRDETLFSNRPFRDLAWGLASQGIAVLRFDKRTNAHAGKMKAIAATITVKDEVLDDALAAVALLRKTAHIDRRKIFVLGHSLGAICVPKIGTLDREIAGLIAMAGTTRPLEDVVADQLAYILSLGGMTEDQKKKTEEMQKQAAALKDVKLTPDMPTAKMPLGMTAIYLISLHEIDPRMIAEQVQQPMLILQGERDYQATMEDFAGWKKAYAGHQNVTFKSYPALNHLFMEGKGKATPEEYNQSGHVAGEVIDNVARWVKTQ